jgi:murein DD-endopeptidase MepM/ murein hydrolase activator NlpD
MVRRVIVGRRGTIRGAAWLLLALVMVVAPWGAAAQSPTPGANGFSPPLGFRDGHLYGVHIEYDASGALVENTDYAAQNPDLQGATCFGVPWQQLYHSGQDLYRADGQSTAGAEVTAIGDGKVVYANPNLNYPGLVVIIEHAPAAGTPVSGTLYSVYAHLDDNSLSVTAGETVTRGQRLGTVMYQMYTGRFPQRHPSGDDSHLHFEIRRFFSGRNIYTAYPACNGLIAGRGYTYPQPPDDFPSPGAGYVNPSSQLSP